MNLMAIPLALMLLLCVGELLLRQWRRGEAPPWREFAFNLGSGNLVMWCLRSVEVAAFALVAQYANLHWLDRWSPLAVWTLAFVGWDFCFYWMHRLHHRIPLLWAVHVVHHQGEHFNLSLGVRNSWYSSLTDLPFVIGLAVIGVPVEVFVVVSSIHYGIQFYNHNGVVGDCGVLEKFLVTPAHHKIHHAMAPIYRNRNFGGTFLCWDQLFGTYQPRVAGVALEYGVSVGRGSDNPLVANHAPFLRGRRAGHCGEGPVPALRGLPVGLGGAALFLVVAAFILGGQGGLNTRAWVGFALIVAASGALGGMAEGRRWAFPAWLGIAAGLCALALVGLTGCTPGANLPYVLGVGASALLLVHALGTLARVNRVGRT